VESLLANTLQQDLLRALYIIFSIGGIFVVFYAAWIGWKMGTASDETKRKEAKKRLINAGVSMFLIIVMVAMLVAIDGITGSGGENANTSDISLSTTTITSGGGVIFVTTTVDGNTMMSGRIYRFVGSSPTSGVTLPASLTTPRTSVGGLISLTGVIGSGQFTLTIERLEGGAATVTRTFTITVA